MDWIQMIYLYSKIKRFDRYLLTKNSVYHITTFVLSFIKPIKPNFQKLEKKHNL